MADTGHQPMHIEQHADVSKIEEWQVRGLLQMQFPKTEFSVHKIQENVFAFGNKNTWAFVDKTGKMLISLNQIRWFEWTSSEISSERKQAFNLYASQIGYREEHDAVTKKRNLYDIRNSKEVLIPQNTKEYYAAWKDIDFSYERFVMLVRSKGKEPFNGTEQERLGILKDISMQVSNWILRINDIILLSLPRLGYVKKNEFYSLVDEAKKHLLSQIGDIRYEKMTNPVNGAPGYPVTQEELDAYLRLKLIDTDFHGQAIKQLEQVNKTKQSHKDGHSSITNQAQIQVASLMKENGNMT